MPFHGYRAGSWTEEYHHFQGQAGFTDGVDDQAWAWDGTTWQLIQPTPSSEGFALLPVENLRVHDDYPTDSAIRFLWDLPTQVITPNEVWIRSPVQSMIWLIYTYPKTQHDLLGLYPLTTYTMDVKLVLREGLTVTAESPVRSLAARTTNVSTPGVPSGGGPGGGGDTTIPTPPLDNPGPVGGGTNCWWQGQLQQWVGDAWVDVGPLMEVESEEDFDIDESVFTAGGIYRFCIREKCNPGGVTGDWTCREPFVLPDDWDDPCADHVDAQWTVPPFDDSVVLLPKICAPDEVHELYSDAELEHGPKWGGITDGPYGTAESLALLGGGGSDVDIVVYGEADQVSDVGPDASFMVLLKSATWPDGYSSLARFGGVNLGVFQNEDGARPYVELLTLVDDVDTVVSSVGSIAYPVPESEWFAITARVDSTNGGVTLHLSSSGAGGTQVATTAIDGPLLVSTDQLAMALPGAGEGAYMAAWDRLLTEEEIASVFDPVFNMGESWTNDPNPIAYDHTNVSFADFTCPVTGFYRITARGARGANGTGMGAEIVGIVFKSAGDHMGVLCGSVGTINAGGQPGGGDGGAGATTFGKGGGGYSAVVDGSYANYAACVAAIANYLIIGGGGGGDAEFGAMTGGKAGYPSGQNGTNGGDGGSPDDVGRDYQATGGGGGLWKGGGGGGGRKGGAGGQGAGSAGSTGAGGGGSSDYDADEVTLVSAETVGTINTHGSVVIEWYSAPLAAMTTLAVADDAEVFLPFSTPGARYNDHSGNARHATNPTGTFSMDVDAGPSSTPRISMDGTTSQLQIANDATWMNDDGQTVEFWIKAASGAGTQSAVTARDANSAGGRYWVCYLHSTDQMRCYSNNSVGPVFTANADVADGNWHQVVWRWNWNAGDRTAEVFIDGVLDSTQVAIGLKQGTDPSPIYIGANPGHNTRAGIEVAMFSAYSYELSDAQILAHFNAID